MGQNKNDHVDNKTCSCDISDSKTFFIDTESSYHHIFIKANGLSKDQDQCLKG